MRINEHLTDNCYYLTDQDCGLGEKVEVLDRLLTIKVELKMKENVLFKITTLSRMKRRTLSHSKRGALNY